MEPGPIKHRAGQLDGIRALCVAAVVFSHSITGAYRIGGYSLFELGSYGVYMFFVLSGYLITAQLLAMRAAPGGGIGAALGLFYVRRILRLMPAYYLAVAVAALLNLPRIRAELPWHLLQLSDLLFALDPQAEDASAAGHLWSLTIEWQFYLVWPLAILFVPKRGLPWLMAGALLAAALGQGLDGLLPMVVERMNLFYSLGPLAAGAGLAWLEARGASFGWLRGAVVASAVVCAGALGAQVAGSETMADWLSMPALQATALLFAAAVHRAARGFTGRVGAVLDAAPLRYIGRISYGIYLYHMFILAAGQKAWLRLGWGELPWGTGLAVALFAVTTLVAAVSWHVVERPINGMRDRFRPRRRAALPLSVPA